MFLHVFLTNAWKIIKQTDNKKIIMKKFVHSQFINFLAEEIILNQNSTNYQGIFPASTFHGFFQQKVMKSLKTLQNDHTDSINALIIIYNKTNLSFQI